MRSPGKLVEPGHYTDRLVLRRGRRFREDDFFVLVDGDQIRVSAADIDTDGEPSHEPCPAACAVKPCSSSRARASGDRCSGGPQPPPPEDRISRQSPGRMTMPTSLARNTRGSWSADSSR